MFRALTLLIVSLRSNQGYTKMHGQPTIKCYLSVMNHWTLQERVTVIGDNILKQNVYPETGCMKKFINP